MVTVRNEAMVNLPHQLTCMSPCHRFSTASFELISVWSQVEDARQCYEQGQSALQVREAEVTIGVILLSWRHADLGQEVEIRNNNNDSLSPFIWSRLKLDHLFFEVCFCLYDLLNVALQTPEPFPSNIANELWREENIWIYG